MDIVYVLQILRSMNAVYLHGLSIIYRIFSFGYHIVGIGVSVRLHGKLCHILSISSLSMSYYTILAATHVTCVNCV